MICVGNLYHNYHIVANDDLSEFRFESSFSWNVNPYVLISWCKLDDFINEMKKFELFEETEKIIKEFLVKEEIKKLVEG